MKCETENKINLKKYQEKKFKEKSICKKETKKKRLNLNGAKIQNQ